MRSDNREHRQAHIHMYGLFFTEFLTVGPAPAQITSHSFQTSHSLFLGTIRLLSIHFNT